MKILHLALAFVAILPKLIFAQCGANPTSGLATITTTNQTINSYYPGTGNPLTGATSLTVGAIDSRGNATTFAAGDLVLIIQMQGAI